MHPIPPQVCKGKTYARRRDEEHVIFEQHKKNQYNGKQCQIKMDNDNLQQNKLEHKDFNRPKEDSKTQRDCAAGHRPGNQVKTGRPYKNEQEE
eukprot:10935213-Heterocapsa_arctica.AAC.1